MTKDRRVLAWVAAAAVCVVLLFSSFFIAAEAAHTCSDSHCGICCQLNQCEQAVKSLAHAVIFTAALFAAINTGVLFCFISFADRRRATLITLKVKLSN